MSLRVEARTGEVVLVWPPRGSEKSALRFVSQNRDWIDRKRREGTQPPQISPGMTLDILGCPYVVTHAKGRGVTRIEDGKIIVRGDPAHLKRRLKDFLKAEAEKILSLRTREKTENLGLKPRPVRIRDPETRWGSCGADGRIMFSWRLILAPEAVMDYVVAHEVAHRVHMNHGRKFWMLCAALTNDAAASRRWLKVNGQRLLRVL